MKKRSRHQQRKLAQGAYKLHSGRAKQKAPTQPQKLAFELVRVRSNRRPSRSYHFGCQHEKSQ